MLEIYQKSSLVLRQRTSDLAVLLGGASAVAQHLDGSSCNPIRLVRNLLVLSPRSEALANDGCDCLAGACLPKGTSL